MWSHWPRFLARNRLECSMSCRQTNARWTFPFRNRCSRRWILQEDPKVSPYCKLHIVDPKNIQFVLRPAPLMMIMGDLERDCICNSETTSTNWMYLPDSPLHLHTETNIQHSFPDIYEQERRQRREGPVWWYKESKCKIYIQNNQ